jgi:lipoprotein-releasing system permease protein
VSQSAGTADMTQQAPSPRGAGPFSAYERMVAWRYLRSRRKDAVISVIASISFIGIMLGVATLIIVMAVMNGFREELLDRILGINGHLIVQPIDRAFDDYDAVAARIEQVPGVEAALPLVEGQVLASGTVGAGTGALVRGVRPDDMGKLEMVSTTSATALSSALLPGRGWRSASAWPMRSGSASATASC